MKIPEWNVEKFLKTIDSLERKGAKFTVVDNGRQLETVGNTDYLVRVYEVTNETVYAVPGWEFVGTIEHHEPLNIIRTINDGFVVPERYKTCGPECEHCYTIRDRKDTYLVRSTDTGDYKQVGKSCLKAYTGLNPSMCTWSLNLESYLYNLQFDEKEDYGGRSGVYGRFVGFDTKEVIALGMADIKNRGYKSPDYTPRFEDTTKWRVHELIGTKNPPKATDEEVNAFLKWVEERENTSNYDYNAKIACNLDYCQYRDFGYILSYVNTYFKDLAKKAAEEKRKSTLGTLTYAGVEGEKITFTVDDFRVLYWKEPYTYGASSTAVYRIVDTEGHVIIWSTTASGMEEGATIKATIKKLQEYRGEKQTVVTRGKIIYSPREEKRKEREKNEDDEVGKALDMFFNDFEDLD